MRRPPGVSASGRSGRPPQRLGVFAWFRISSSPEIIRISPAATRSCHETVVPIDLELIQRKAYDARRSTRGREIHTFHEGDDGSPDEDRFLLLDAGRNVHGCDIRPGVWHTIFALVPDTVIFEVKPGPYDPASDKDFATWAPPEYSPPAPAYLAEIEDGSRRLCGLPQRLWPPPATGS